MAAHSTASMPADLDPGGVERVIARRMPTLMLGAVAVLAILWWMAAQPPPGPGWNAPNGPPQQQWPQQGQGQGYGQQPGRPVPPNPPSAGCTLCAGIDCVDCMSGLDCGDCIDCGDCLSGLDCTCAVSGAPVTRGVPTATKARTCSTNPWKRLAGSSGLLLPLFVMIGWRRRLRR